MSRIDKVNSLRLSIRLCPTNTLNLYLQLRPLHHPEALRNSCPRIENLSPSKSQLQTQTLASTLIELGKMTWQW